MHDIPLDASADVEAGKSLKKMFLSVDVLPRECYQPCTAWSQLAKVPKCDFQVTRKMCRAGAEDHCAISYIHLSLRDYHSARVSRRGIIGIPQRQIVWELSGSVTSPPLSVDSPGRHRSSIYRR